MKKIKIIRKCSKFCLILSAIILVIVAGFALSGVSLPSAIQLIMVLALFAAVIAVLAGIILFVISIIMSLLDKAPRKISASDFRIRLDYYNSLPYYEIDDYAEELNAIRENYSKSDPKSNIFDVPDYIAFRPLKNFKVFETGKIYYGSLVQANEELFKETRVERVLPAVVVYSQEEYYEKNPEELGEIAHSLFANKENNCLKNETEYMFHMPVDESLTNGRKVYMSTLLINTKQFPLNYISGGLFPIIADPEQSKSVFVIDSKYWTDKFLGNFIHVNNIAKRVEEYANKFSNISYCEIESFRKERDFMWDKLFNEHAVENLCERGKEELFDGLDGKPNPKICYGYVIAADKDWQLDTKMKRLYLSALIVYGYDSEYVDNPEMLATDVKSWVAGINPKEFLKKFDGKRTAIQLAPEVTGGRLAYAAQVIISRLWLPEGRLSGMVLPIVADSNAPEEVNFIPVHYWSNRFIGNFKGKKTI